MVPMARPQVLYVGDRDWPEFVGPVQWLNDNVDVMFATDVTSAYAAAASREMPFDVIVVAQRRPSDYANAVFDELRACVPLTPIVCLLGSFCEGEARTGTPWLGAVRVYSHQFVARTGAELARLGSYRTTTWAPPFTATDEDRLLASPPQSMPKLTARVAVISHDRQTASALCDALQSAGCSPTSHPEDLAEFDDNADVVVWDCAAGMNSGRASFDRLVQHVPRTPKIVLVGFPRAEDTAVAVARGATAVVSKPFLVEDLLWQLRESLGL
jgi:CheY-like chemotaxis protein